MNRFDMEKELPPYNELCMQSMKDKLIGEVIWYFEEPFVTEFKGETWIAFHGDEEVELESSDEVIEWYANQLDAIANENPHNLRILYLESTPEIIKTGFSWQKVNFAGMWEGLEQKGREWRTSRQ